MHLLEAAGFGKAISSAKRGKRGKSSELPHSSGDRAFLGSDRLQIDCRGGETAMTQPSLQQKKCHAAHHRVKGEAVTEALRAGMRSGRYARDGHHRLDGLPGEPAGEGPKSLIRA